MVLVLLCRSALALRDQRRWLIPGDHMVVPAAVQRDAVLSRTARALSPPTDARCLPAMAHLMALIIGPTPCPPWTASRCSVARVVNECVPMTSFSRERKVVRPTSRSSKWGVSDKRLSPADQGPGHPECVVEDAHTGGSPRLEAAKVLPAQPASAPRVHTGLGRRTRSRSRRTR